MNVLVTGGAGYIGSHTIRLLLEKGFTPIVIDSLENGHKKSLRECVQFYEGDISDVKLLDKIFQENKIDAVLHFAGYIEAGESMENPLKFYNNNVSNASIFLQQVVKHGVKKFIFSSSAGVYGQPDKMPITENMETKPTSHYGWTKLYFERILDSTKAYGVKNICLRYFNASGAGYNVGEDHYPETHLIPLVLQVANGKRDCIKVFGTDYDTPDGTCIRDYVHVLDLASAHVAALEALDKGITGKFNVGSGKGSSVKEIIDTAKKVTGKEIKVVQEDRRAGDPAELVASAEKIKQVMGWEPKYGLREIMKTAWLWHKTHPNGFSD